MSLTVTDKGNATTDNINGHEVYKFTTVGTSSVTFSGSGTIDLLVVGGAGGMYFKAKTFPQYDGGAGGFIEILEYPINAGAGTKYNIVVGQSGTVTINPSTDPAKPSDGTTSSFDNIEAAGGGGGGGGKSVTSGKKGCGGSGGLKQTSILKYEYANAGSSNVSGISGKVTYKSNGAAEARAGGAVTKGKGIESEIINKMCSSADAKSASDGAYGSRVNTNTTEGNGIVAFRISAPVTTAPVTTAPVTTTPVTTTPVTTGYSATPSVTTGYTATPSVTTGYTTTPSVTTGYTATPSVTTGYTATPSVTTGYTTTPVTTGYTTTTPTPSVTTPSVTTRVPTTPSVTTRVPTTPSVTTPSVTTRVPTTMSPTTRVPTTPRVPCITKSNFGIPVPSSNNNIASYIYNENDYLKQSKMHIENAKEEKNRIDDMQDSHRKYIMEYIKMIIVLCIVLAFLWIIRVLYENELLPDGALDFLTIIIISVGCIVEYILYFGIPSVYIGIVSRNSINFDEIDYDPPEKNSTTTTTIIPSITPTNNVSAAQCNPPLNR
jgi:hypothetical protein